MTSGENVLHMAIVNEDPSMVRFLLDNGVNCLEACNGNFFTPEDQERTDNRSTQKNNNLISGRLIV